MLFENYSRNAQIHAKKTILPITPQKFPPVPPISFQKRDYKVFIAITRS